MSVCSFRVLIEYIKINSSTRTIIDTSVSISELTPLFQEISMRDDFVSFSKIEFVNMWDERACSQFPDPKDCKQDLSISVSDNEDNEEDESIDFITHEEDW